MRVRYQRGPAMSGDDGETVETMATCYEPPRPRSCHTLTDPVVTATAVAVSLGAWSGWWVIGALLGAVLVVLILALDAATARWMLVTLVLLGAAAGVRGAHELDRLGPRVLGPLDGWVQVIGDPRPMRDAVRVVVRVEGQRYEAWVRDSSHRARVLELQGGQWVHVRGELRPLSSSRAERVVWQHVVGSVRLDELGPVAPGGRVATASNAVRRAVDRASAELESPHDALFRGLVIGDRRGQPDHMVERFRATGLSHLTVVSGLNVALLLVLVGPFVRRLRPSVRWGVTLAIIVWFAGLTRFEPSIMRASAMAALSATAFLLGRDRAPFRLLCLAVAALVLVDPLLVHSAGFWLSVGATAGVCTVGPWLAARLRVLGPLATPVGVTVGAQVGVVVPLVATFGSLPLVSVPANLVAVPVASVVKLYGLPAAVVAGWVPWLATPLMLPCRLGVWWVDQVASSAARLEPDGAATWIGWGLLTVGLAAVVARYGVVDDGAPPHR
jgi:competence protein ComEC